MSDAYRFLLKLADGRYVAGPIQGSGGVLTRQCLPWLLESIDRAQQGEPLGMYEPQPGHVCMFPDYSAEGQGVRLIADLRGAHVITDLPYEVAMRAHSGTSMVPDERAVQEINGYAMTLTRDYANMSELADTDVKRASLAVEFERYREGYRTHVIAHLGARARCLSVMVTGGSNFPTRRNEKRNNTSDKRLGELLEYRKRTLAAIRKVLTPEDQPIRSDEPDAVVRLRAELAKATKTQERMRDANAAIRKHAKAGPEAQIVALEALGLPRSIGSELIKPDYCGRIGFADYQMKNNGANMRRIEGRIAELSARDVAPDRESIEGEGFRIEENRREGRVQIFFPGKPDESIRTRLKACGFKWAPSQGAWQRLLNDRAWYDAQRAMGLAS